MHKQKLEGTSKADQQKWLDVYSLCPACKRSGWMGLLFVLKQETFIGTQPSSQGIKPRILYQTNNVYIFQYGQDGLPHRLIHQVTELTSFNLLLSLFCSKDAINHFQCLVEEEQEGNWNLQTLNSENTVRTFRERFVCYDLHELILTPKKGLDKN